MKKISYYAFFFVSLLSLTSCFDQGAPSPILGSVGVVMPALDDANPRWKNEYGQLKKTLIDAYYTVAFGVSKDNDVKMQYAQIKEMIGYNVESLIVTSVNTSSDLIGKAISEYVKETKGKVLCYDRLQLNTKDVDLLLAPSNAEMGVMQYKACAALPSGSTIEVLAGPAWDINASELFSSMMDSVSVKINNMQWVCRSGRLTFDKVSQDTWGYDAAMVYTIDLLDNYYYGGKLPDAIIAANDAQADGVIKAVELYNEKFNNKEMYPIITGMDNTEAARKRIAQGKQTMTIDKNPAGMVKDACGVIIKWKAKEEVKTAKTVNNGVKDVPYLPVSGVKPIYKKDIQ